MLKIALVVFIQISSSLAFSETELFGLDLDLNLDEFREKYEDKVDGSSGGKYWKFGIRNVHVKSIRLKPLDSGQEVSAEFIENGKGQWELLELASSKGNFKLSEVADVLSKKIGKKIKLNFKNSKCGMNEDTPCTFYDTSVNFHNGEVEFGGRDMYRANVLASKIDMKVYGYIKYTNLGLKKWFLKKHSKPKTKMKRSRPKI